MGSWSMKYFGRDVLPQNAIIIPGTTGDEQKQKYLSLFDRVVDYESNLFEWYILEKDEIKYLLMLRIYGAPMVIDLIHILKEGQVEKVIFIGAAFGFGTNIKIGDIVLPSQVQALDGILTTFEATSYTQPNNDLLQLLTDVFGKEKMKYKKGKTVSIPSVFTKIDRNLFDSDVLALEMETSTFLYYTARETIKSVAILVISDTEKHKLTDVQNNRYISMLNVIGILLKNSSLLFDDSQLK